MDDGLPENAPVRLGQVRGRRRVLADLVLVALFFAWLIVPFLLIMQDFGVTADAPGARCYLDWSMACLVGLPLLGMCVGAAAQRRLAPTLFGVAALLSAVIAVLAFSENQPDQAPAPAPVEPTHCVIYSGGTDDCPGG